MQDVKGGVCVRPNPVMKASWPQLNIKSNQT